MKKSFTRIIAVLLIVALLASSLLTLTGCRREHINDEPIVSDDVHLDGPDVSDPIQSEDPSSGTSPDGAVPVPSPEVSDTSDSSIKDNIQVSPRPGVTSEPIVSKEPEVSKEPDADVTPVPTPEATPVSPPKPTQAPHTHSYTSTVVAPTCSANGYTLYSCSCGASYADNYVDRAEHTIVTIPAVAATCTTSGMSEYKKCSVCGTMTILPASISATGHNYGEWVVAVEATATTAGTKVQTCKNCGDEKSATMPATGGEVAGDSPVVEEHYIDPRIESMNVRGAIHYWCDYDGDLAIRVVDERTWGEAPSIWIYDDSWRIVYYLQDGTKCEELLIQPVGHSLTCWIQEDGTTHHTILGSYT